MVAYWQQDSSLASFTAAERWEVVGLCENEDMFGEQIIRQSNTGRANKKRSD